MKIDAGPQRPRRRMNLTPMIDVVFLLLVFFMMVSRFGGLHGLPMAVAGQGGTVWTGPPRLVDLRGALVALNGVATPLDALPQALAALMQAPNDPIILRPDAAASVQDMVVVLETLRAAGLTQLVVVN